MSKQSFQFPVPSFQHGEQNGGRIREGFALCVAVALITLLVGCSVNEGRTESGEKRVDIRTPFADLKINTDVDIKDTGLPAYPGAQPLVNTEHDEKAANVNISGAGFGLKVVALKFRTDDPPDKVLAFYRPKMKDFGGKYLECKQKGFIAYNHHNEDRELTCDTDRDGPNFELKAGTPDRQHIVAVKPKGSGSEFALVYVSKHGKEGM